MSELNRAVLVDAYSQIFRVFYAIRALSRADGFPTNALFGMARLLMQLENELNPAAGAFFFDCGKPAFRLELAPEYKSNRPPMPEDLQKQMPLLREMIGLFGWNICQCTNYEADDLIGAAVKNLPERSFAIISSDKDLSQLINENTCMLVPARSGGGFEKRGVEETVEKFSVTPSQIIDYLSLLGDSSDVITGVAGIGPKTAAGILQSCDSLAGFFAAPERLANAKQREKLLAAREQLERNQKLVTLRTTWPEELETPEKVLVKREPDWQKIAEMARTYELKSVLRDLPVKIELSAPVEKAPAPAADDLFAWSAPAGKAEEIAPEKTENRPAQGTLF